MGGNRGRDTSARHRPSGSHPDTGTIRDGSEEALEAHGVK
ncbi:Uncharacterised protein [Dermatophilus congolensis]|uniref:Uncharacterized protein n=1 Tax=Dermatophilus congolensis TaxID=1863 RepID=A0A239VEG2_9MICO|nr:Uncharacterised protein [Dermatophilus congolensis]STD05307.1 Uncharacterised protein [Dermatophilus congolensis]